MNIQNNVLSIIIKYVICIISLMKDKKYWTEFTWRLSLFILVGLIAIFAIWIIGITLVWAFMLIVNKHTYGEILFSMFGIAMFALSCFTILLPFAKKWSEQKYYMNVRLVSRMTTEQVELERERMSLKVEKDRSLSLSRRIRKKDNNSNDKNK